MRSTVLKFATVVLAILVLAQLALWYSASRWFSELARQASPFATLDYRASYAWLNGKAGIRSVRIQPHGMDGNEVSAGRIELDVGDGWTLLRLLRSGIRSLPQDLGLNIERLILPTDVERSLRDQSSRLGYLMPFEAMGCNERGRFAGTDFANLDWLHSETDMRFRLRNDSRNHRVVFGFDQDQRSQGRLEVEMELSGIVLSDASMGQAWSDLRLDRLQARFFDRGLVAQRNAYCTRALNVNQAEFVERHMTAVAEEMEARGIFLDPRIYDIYRGFAQRGGSLELSATPSGAVPLARYDAYLPKDRIDLLNATIRHDQGAPAVIRADFFTQGASSAAASTPETGGSVRIRAQADHADRIEFDELGDLIGRRIVLRTRTGSGYVGTLLDIQGTLVRIEVDRGGRVQRSLIDREVIEEIRLAD